jgi:hypothetical protein
MAGQIILIVAATSLSNLSHRFALVISKLNKTQIHSLLNYSGQVLILTLLMAESLTWTTLSIGQRMMAQSGVCLLIQLFTEITLRLNITLLSNLCPDSTSSWFKLSINLVVDQIQLCTSLKLISCQEWELELLSQQRSLPS